MGFLEKLFGGTTRSKSRSHASGTAAAFNARQARLARAGSVDGSHFTEYVEHVKQLKRDRRHDEAIALLCRLVEATEAEAREAGEGWGVAPWYYEQLAIIYRKETRFADEVSILKRYETQAKAPGRGPTKLSERLAKAQALLRREEDKGG